MSSTLNADEPMLATPQKVIQKAILSSQQETQKPIAAAEAHFTAITTQARPATLAEHIELTVLYLTSDDYTKTEESKSMPLDSAALTLIAGELVLWRNRTDPDSFPIIYTPWTVKLVVKFCNRLTSGWNAFSICTSSYVKGKKLEAPTIICGFLRRDATESNAKKRKRLPANTANDDDSNDIQTSPVPGHRKEGQKIKVSVQISGYFPTFAFKDKTNRNVKQSDVALDQDARKALARLAGQYNARQKAFVKEENEKVLLAAARWRLYLNHLDESKQQREIAVCGAASEPDKMQETLHVHDFNEEIMYEFVDEFRKSSASWKQQSTEGDSDED